MNNEQQRAKELAELLTAFADGKQFEFRYTAGWEDFREVTTASIYTHFERIRIKPETKRIALNQQDLIDRELRKETMRLSNGELILSWSHKYVTTAGNTYSYKYLLDKEFTFLDGTPCYKEVECEL